MLIMCHTCTLLFPEAKAREIAGRAVNAVARIRAGRLTFWAKAEFLSFLQRTQSSSGAHTASNPMSTMAYFPRGKAAGLRS